MLELNIQGKHCFMSWFPFPLKLPVGSLAQLQVVLEELWGAEMPLCV